MLSKVLENPIWSTLGALVGIVGLVVSGIEIYQALQTPPVDLQIAALTIDAQQSIEGRVTGGGGASRSVEFTPIDITLQNRGGEPSLITAITAEVIYFQQLRDCTGVRSTPESITAKYQLPIPMEGVKPAGKQLSVDTRFEVKPGAADRMALSLGPSTQPAFSTAPMVMSAKIKLMHDGNQAIEPGTVSLVTTVGAAIAQIDMLNDSQSSAAKDCARENLTYLDQMFEIQSTRSRVLERLRSAYQRAAV